MHTVFGIRHHGPGSARSLLKALDTLKPDKILIEGPADANDLIQYIAYEALIPPVALLVYNPRDLAQGAYYPFATFSPEWNAIKYALTNEVDVQFMDLPKSIHFGLDDAEKENPQLDFDNKKVTIPSIHRDPLGYLANIAGYEDGERWWEATFEKSEGHETVFQSILEMMKVLRTELGIEESPREKLREAYMRTEILKAIKEGHKNIAVICGAWHAPVLQDLHGFKPSVDKALLKGRKKIKTKATWVPWTYDRLAKQSGYKAGVVSPAWCKLLFTHREEVVIRWMTEVARLMREEDIPASSAHSIEAVRLSDTLASLRDLSIPGIQELLEAATTVFGEGHESRVDLIKQKLIVGDVIGSVPEEIPVVPLQNDLEKSIKSARLSKERQSTEAVEKKLDLRTATNLLASHLLHRLNVLNIPWGKTLENSKFDTGSFSEIWKLKWLPDFAISIIEAGMWGNTVYTASTAFIQKKALDAKELPELTPLIENALKADLKDAIEFLVDKLQAVSALTKDVYHLMDALPALVNVLRYGSTRQMDVSAVGQVVEQLIPRICVALPNTCMGVDEEMSVDLFKKILNTNRAIHILKNEDHIQLWEKALIQISTMQNVNGILGGACTRILFDKNKYDLTQTAQLISYALSIGNAAQDAAYWLEGFLYGSGLLLVHNPELWQVIDDWVEELPMDMIKEVLPLLRRTFAKFSEAERKKMMELAIQEKTVLKRRESDRNIDFDKRRGEKVLETLRLLLGGS